MKHQFRYLSFSLCLTLILCIALATSSYAQTPASTDPNSASAPPPAQQRKGVMTAEELKKVDPVLAEQVRYQFFLLDVHVIDLSEKSLRDRGYVELAEAARTELQRNSGLTDEEATKVKQIAADYMLDVDALNRKGAELAAKYGHRRPPEAESQVLSQEHVDIVNKAITRLVDELGSRSFSRLDLYTRHYSEIRRAKTDADTKAAASRREGKP